METKELSQEQKEALQESLSRGLAFEELIRTNGWKYVKAYFQSRVQAFANSLLLEDEKKIEEFENTRREIIGLKKLLGVVDNDIKILEDERAREKVKESAAK